jgi:pyruvate kinase
MTKIIATIGPASMNKSTLDFFSANNVQIARMNFSHNTPEWHLESAILARQSGLELLFDLPGPKIRLGDITEVTEVRIGDIVKIEMQKVGQTYPYKAEYSVFPYQFPVHQFVEVGHTILVDDGKLNWQVIQILEDAVICKVIAGGAVKSRKGMNMPESSLEVNFLGDRDKTFLGELLPKLKPEYVAASFVKTRDDILQIKQLLTQILEENSITDYFPNICAKLEMKEAVEGNNLFGIVQEADLIMIARGDLALETVPAHISVPFLQEKIEAECRRQNKPFVVATQILESMIDCPVPTRAEVSDLYRAVVLDKADFIMCSGETAAGKYPRQCIQLMSDMINSTENNENQGTAVISDSPEITVINI